MEKTELMRLWEASPGSDGAAQVAAQSPVTDRQTDRVKWKKNMKKGKQSQALVLCWQHCNAASPSRAVQIMTPKSKLALTPGSEILLLLRFSSISSFRIVVSFAFVCVSGRRMRRMSG